MANATSREEALAKMTMAAALIAVAKAIRLSIDEQQNEQMLPLWHASQRMIDESDRLAAEAVPFLRY